MNGGKMGDMNPDISIRELRISEVLKEALIIFKSGLKYIVPLCLLAFIPLNIFELLIGGGEQVLAVLSNPAEFVMGAQMGGYLRNVLLSQLIRLIFTSLIIGGYTYIALSRYTDKALTLGGILDHTFGKWLWIVFTGVLYYAIVLSVSFLIIPVIYFSVLFIFCRNVAAISTDKGFRAFAAAAGLVRGNFFKRLLYAAVFILLQTGVTFLVVLLLGGFIAGPASAEAMSAGAGIGIVALNVLVDILASILLMAQAVWFINILFTRNAVLAGMGAGD